MYGDDGVAESSTDGGDVIYAYNATSVFGGGGNDTIYAYYDLDDLSGISIDGGSGNDKIYVMGASPTANQRALVYTGTGQDTVVAGGNGSYITTWRGGPVDTVADTFIVQPGTQATMLTYHGSSQGTFMLGNQSISGLLVDVDNVGYSGSIGGGYQLQTLYGDEAEFGPDFIKKPGETYIELKGGAFVGLGIQYNEDWSWVGGEATVHNPISTPAVYVDSYTQELDQLIASYTTGGEGTPGDDILDGSGSASNDTYDGGAGTDRISYVSTTQGVNVNLATGQATGSEIGTDTLINIENARGGTGNDTLTGAADANVLEGKAGNDSLQGGGGADTLYGDDGNDYAQGGDGDDYVYGWTGNDTLYGGAGADFLGGDDGNDFMKGEDGDDTLYGWNGSDTLYGDNGNDVLSGEADGDSLIGGNGNDTLYGGDGSDTLDGGAGGDVLDGGAGLDTADYSQSTSAVNVQLWNNSASGGYAAGDSLTSIENLTGSAYADVLVGNAHNNLLNGGAGNDTLNGGQGSNTLIGGNGDDLLRGHFGADAMDGGSGTDTADYSLSTAGVTVALWNNTASGGYAAGDSFTSIENLIGSAYGDSLTGNAVSNRIDGGAGDDTLNGGQGSNTLIGGNGDDVLRGHEGADAMDGGAGTDTADYSLSTAGVTVQLWNNTASGGYAAGDSFTSIENLIGSAYADNLVGNAVSNRIDGGAGNDTLNGGQGSNTLIGGNGDDVLRGHEGADAMDGGAGTDTADYSLSTAGVTVALSNNTASGGYAAGDSFTSIENLTGSSYNDNLTGGSGINILLSGSGNDTLNGGQGNDTLNGGAGKDTLTGGSEADVFKFSLLTDSYHTGSNYDRITDFQAGVDKIDLTGLGFTTLVSGGSTQTGELRLAYSSASDRTYVRSDQLDFEFYLDGDYTATLTNADFIF